MSEYNAQQVEAYYAIRDRLDQPQVVAIDDIVRPAQPHAAESTPWQLPTFEPSENLEELYAEAEFPNLEINEHFERHCKDELAKLFATIPRKQAALGYVTLLEMISPFWYDGIKEDAPDKIRNIVDDAKRTLYSYLDGTRSFYVLNHSTIPSPPVPWQSDSYVSHNPSKLAAWLTGKCASSITTLGTGRVGYSLFEGLRAHMYKHNDHQERSLGPRTHAFIQEWWDRFHTRLAIKDAGTADIEVYNK